MPLAICNGRQNFVFLVWIEVAIPDSLIQVVALPFEFSEHFISTVYHHDRFAYLSSYEKTLCILKIKTTKKLKELSAFVKKGIFDLSPGLYRNVGIPLIRTSEIKSATINFSSTVFIDEQTHRANAGTQLCPRDIVFTKIGANIGDVALLPDTFDKYNFSQNVVGVSIKDKKLSPYLLMFFLSKTGRAQVMRSVMLSGQGKLELEDIRNYKIPLMSDKFIDAINGIYNRISQNNKKASLLYKQAGQLLSSIIKLDNIARLKENISIKSFSESFGNIGRLDAEYYQPQYEAYKRALHTIDTVSSLCDIHDKNYNPNSEEIYKYIELANVGNSGDISNVELIKGSELPSRARRKVNQGQVIISSVE